jgi:hypothetical protein
MEGIKEAVWWRSLVGELEFLQENPTPISYDNMCNMKIERNQIFHARMKHIRCHYHFMCEKVLSKEVKLIRPPSDEQLVGISSKEMRLRLAIVSIGSSKNLVKAKKKEKPFSRSYPVKNTCCGPSIVATV